MTCRDHAEPVEGCCGCAGRWDRAMAETVLAGMHGIEAATLRMAIAEIDGLVDVLVGERRHRAADLAEWRATYEAMRAEIDALRCGDLAPYFDGELSAERRDAFCAHLARCKACEAGLLGLMQQDAVVSSGIDRGKAVIDAAVAWVTADGPIGAVIDAVNALDE